MHRIQEELLKLSQYQDLSRLSLRDIGKLINEPQANKVRHHIKSLEDRGLIKIDRRKSKIRLKDLQRSSSTSDSSSELAKLPIYGEANCGLPTSFAIQETNSYLTLSRSILKKSKDTYVLIAKGNSMNRHFINGKNIEDGDYLIIDPQVDNPQSGDVVVSIIDGCANIKIFHYDRKEKRIVLFSDSTENFEPIFIDQSDFEDGYLVNGKVIQVIKKFTLP